MAPLALYAKMPPPADFLQPPGALTSRLGSTIARGRDAAIEALGMWCVGARSGHYFPTERERAIPVLAGWECVIGIGLLVGWGLRGTLLLLYLQMLGTLSPIALFPHEVFVRFPYAPTLEGQYIIKNLVLISAGIVVGATVRGGGMVWEPQRQRES